MGNRATCRVIDMETMAELIHVDVEIPMNRYQSALAWTADGRRLAVALSSGKIHVFGVPDARAGSRVFNAGTASFFDWSRERTAVRLLDPGRPSPRRPADDRAADPPRARRCCCPRW